MMEIPHIETIYSSSPVNWLLLLLGGCLVWLLGVRPMIWREGWQSFFSLLERRYTENTSWTGGLLILLFNVSITSLMLYICHLSDGEFVWARWLYIGVLVFGVWIVQRVLMRLVCWVCSFTQAGSMGSGQLLSMWLVLSVIGYALTAAQLVYPMPKVMMWSCIGLAVWYEVAIGVKLCRVFGFSLLSYGYIALYWLTVEILPLFGLWMVAKWIMNNG